ncbi:MAG: hypothetical protein K0Q49_2359 [Haloplasmataceae bacterium]|jgi:RimJ/RimL family protein N-acetyltransferase|nr:hypothetical protein [Haloplasmataceae bacterium]
MLKAGMKYEATLRSRRVDELTGKRVDLVKYSIIKEEL